MFIKNQRITDTDTLFEVLFDFEIGIPSAYMQEIIDEVTVYMNNDKELQAHAATMEEEDRLELLDDIQRERTISILQQKFKPFMVKDAKLYGIVDEKEVLLYAIDMH